MTKAAEYVQALKAAEDDPWWEDVNDEHFEVVGDLEYYEEHRWYTIVRQVIKFDDGSYARVSWEKPASEIQEDQDKNARAEVVRPYEVLVTKFEPFPYG